MDQIAILPDPGGVIDKPGLYRMDEARYHGDPCVTPSASSSLLKVYEEGMSPLHMWAVHPRLNPGAPKKDTAALRLGRAAHMAAFEPDRFSETYAIRPSGLDGRTKEGKAWAEAHRGAETLTAEAAEAITAMAVTIRAHPEAGALLRGAEHEVSGFHQDRETGVWCRVRFDILPRAPDRFLSDYKTSTSIALDDIARSAWEYRWPLQAAFYMDAFAATVGEPARGFAFLVQEKASPFAVRVTPHGRKRH